VPLVVSVFLYRPDQRRTAELNDEQAPLAFLPQDKYRAARYPTDPASIFWKNAGDTRDGIFAASPKADLWNEPTLSTPQRSALSTRHSTPSRFDALVSTP